MKYFFLLLIFSLFFSCKSDIKKNKKPEILNATIKNIFSIKDSLILKYPQTMYPARIYDICFNSKTYYVLGINSKYPIVKFKENGDYIEPLSKVGQGPGEFSFIPEKMDLDRDKLAILLPRLSELYVFKEDQFKQKKFLFYSSDSLAIKKRKGISRPRDISWVGDKLLIFYSGGGSKYQFAVLDSNLKVMKRLIPLPSRNSITGLLLSEYWAVQKNNDFLITHINYPPTIYQFNFINDEIKNLATLKNLELKYFKWLSTDMTYEKVMKFPDRDKLKIFKKYSKLLWVIKKDDKIIGMYSTVNDKKDFYIFILKNNKIILEQKIPPYYIIPEGNELYMEKFSEKSDVVKLYKLKLKV